MSARLAETRPGTRAPKVVRDRRAVRQLKSVELEGLVHWEIGNALSAMMRRRRLTPQLAVRAVESYRSIPIRFMEVDLVASLEIASEHHLHAYDAYLIECARRRAVPLLTLDRALARVASKISIEVMGVE